MLYSVELQLMGIILLSAMVVGAFSLWLKRRRIQNKLDEVNEESSDS